MLNTIDDIRYELKEILQMTRAPKCIKPFWVMKHVWERHQSDKMALNDDRDMFISTKQLKKMNIGTNIYRKYFAAFIEWDSEEYSYKYGKCRTIKRFNSRFTQLMENTLHLDTPKEIVKEYCASITNTSEAGKKHMLEIWKEIGKDEENFYDFYTSTYSSPFRGYNPLQNLKKAERNEMYKGKWDVDMTAAHTTIAFNEFMKDSSTPFAWMLHPENKEMFLDVMQEWFNCDRNKAKEYRCTLTTPFRHPHGVKAFDDLHAEISRNTKSRFGVVEWNGKNINIDTHHKYYTYVEQSVMNIAYNKFEEDNNEVLLKIHDGCHTQNKPTFNSIEYNGMSYPFTAKQLGAA